MARYKFRIIIITYSNGSARVF